VIRNILSLFTVLTDRGYRLPRLEVISSHVKSWLFRSMVVVGVRVRVRFTVCWLWVRIHNIKCQLSLSIFRDLPVTYDLTVWRV